MGDVIGFRAPRPVPACRARPEPLWRELVGASVRAARRASELRLVDLAERAGVSPQYLSEVERGLKDPSSEILAAISGALDLTVIDLAARAARQDHPPSTVGDGPVCLAA